ncbi:hypothetical protein BHE74_00032452 [Ensete ventricosum]|nr:hypothetical protein BHE74_00032452 [Ensete ventricosum]
MPVVGEATDLLPAPPPGFILPRLNISTQQGIRTFDVGCSLLGDLRFGRRLVHPSGRLGADYSTHRPLWGWEGYPDEAPPMPMSGENQELPSWEGEVRVLERVFSRPLYLLSKRVFYTCGRELVCTLGLTLVVPRGTTGSYGGRVSAVVWGEGMARHTTLMAHGGAGQCRTRMPPPRMLGLLPT